MLIQPPWINTRSSTVLFRRRYRRRQPWWTIPISLLAVGYAMVKTERTTKLIWRGIVSRTIYHKLREYLDRKFPPITARRHKFPHIHESVDENPVKR